MTLVSTVVLILGIAAIFAVWLAIYFLTRNVRVFSFRNMVIDLCYERAMKAIKQHKYDESHDWDLYDKLPSYESMLYSFKPLKLESYFTDEEIKELTENK